MEEEEEAREDGLVEFVVVVVAVEEAVEVFEGVN